MNINWSKVHHLSDFASAPKERGVYLIGIYDGADALPASPPPISDTFLGTNFPSNFTMKYIGRAFETTLYARLKDHYEKSSNKHIREYVRGPNSSKLTFIYNVFPPNDAAYATRIVEHLFLWGIEHEWWNLRRTEQKSVENAIRDLVKDVPDSLGWWDPRDG